MFNQVSYLLKLLQRGQDMDMPKEGRNKRTYTVFGGAAILFIMIPCCIIVGVIAYFMTLAMMEAGGMEEGMLFIVQFISACALIFGFNVIINEFYFSSDIDYLLPLPVKTHELIFAKFFVTYQAESVMEFMVIFSAYIGYILAIGISPIGIVTGLLGTITLPLIPLLYCGVISLIVMYFFQGIRNRKVLNGIMALLALALVGGTYLSFRGLESFSIETYVQSLTSGENAFLNVMNRIFYPGYLLVHSAATKNWLEVLIYIVLNLVALGIFLGLANLIYLPGLYSYKSVANKNTHAGKVHMTQKQQSVFWALLKKEVKTIFRTPAFVSNCIVINFFWPILIVIVCIMQKGNGSIQQFTELNQNGNVLASIITLAIFLGLAALTTAANSLASSAFTREGVHIDFMKFIPVPYELQIQVKGLLSIGISFLSYLVDVAVLSYILQLSGKAIAYYVTGGFTLVLFITCLGLCLDSNHPKLIWEDELNALRGNLNVFFNMAFAILATGIIIGVGFLLYLIPHSTIKFIYAVYLILLILLDIYMYDYTMKKTVENLDELAS
jgi:ABC-2 type transport system permease protein